MFYDFDTFGLPSLESDHSCLNCNFFIVEIIGFNVEMNLAPTNALSTIRFWNVNNKMTCQIQDKKKFVISLVNLSSCKRPTSIND